jgi:prepilin-type N-terminal cleavage/methylation domain-containing protein
MRPATDPSSRCGFTLAELMVVVVIIGLMTGAVVLNMHRMVPKEQFVSDVRALSERVHGARSDAVSQNVELWIHYDLDNEKYWITFPFKVGGGAASYARWDDDESGAAQDAEAQADRIRMFETKLSKGVEFVSVTIDGIAYTDGIVLVRFTPQGTSSEHWIVMEQEVTHTVSTIECQGLTGLISFHEGRWDREEAKDTDFN